MEGVCIGKACGAGERSRLKKRDLEEEVLLLREQVRDLADMKLATMDGKMAERCWLILGSWGETMTTLMWSGYSVSLYYIINIICISQHSESREDPGKIIQICINSS